MVYIEINIKPYILMVHGITVSAGLSLLAFLEALNTRATYDTGSCPHLHLFCSFGVSCSHCNRMILWRTTDGVSFVPTLAVLLLRDTTIFMGNSPVSRTWPETSIQAQKCRCIPTGNRSIVWVVAVLLSYTKSLHLLELVGTHWLWQVLPCRGRRGGRCVTAQLPSHCPQQWLQCTELLPLRWGDQWCCSGLCCSGHAAPCSWGRLTFLVHRDPTESWS